MKEFVEKLIEGLEELRVRNFLTIANTGDDKLDCAYEYVGKVLDNTISIINELAEEYSTITPKNLEDGWIPCSDRLPSEEELVLLQTKRDGRMYVGYHRRNGAKWVCVTARNSVVTGMIPIAWQPLPQPYKKGSTDNA